MKLFILAFLFISCSSYTQTLWEPLGFANHNTYNLCDDEKGNIYVISTNDGLYKSTDLGHSWMLIFSGATNLTVDSTNYNPSKLYSSKSNGDIYTSTDYGVNWSFYVNLPNYSDGIYAFIEDTIYKSGGGGILKSTDSGITWVKILSDQDPIAYNLYWDYEFIYRGNHDYLYAVKQMHQPYIGYTIHWFITQISTDFGKSWVELSDGYKDRSPAYFGILFSKYDVFELAFPYYSELYLKNGNQMPGLDFAKGLAVDSRGNIFIACTSGLYPNPSHIYYYKPDGNFDSEIPTDFPITQLKSLYVDSLGFLYASEINNLYKSKFSSLVNQSARMDFPETGLGDSTHLIYALRNPLPYKTIIDSVSINLPFSSSIIVKDSLSPYEEKNIVITFSPSDYGDYNSVSKIFTTYGTYKLTLSGKSIAPQLVHSGIINFGDVPNNKTISKIISIQSSSIVNPIIVDSIHLGTSYFWADSVLFPVSFHAPDSLKLKIDFNPGNNSTCTDTLNLYSHFNNSSILISKILLTGSSTSPQLKYPIGIISIGNTATYTTISKVLNFTNVSSVNPIFVDSIRLRTSYFWADSISYPYSILSPDSLKLKVNFSPGNNSSYKDTLLVFVRYNNNSSEYLFKVRLTGTNSTANVFADNIGLKSYYLSSAFPNPFNPSTTINYSIANAGNVKLTVFNAIGGNVATIVNEYKPAGEYSVQFNASNLPSGIYFYRIQSGSFIDTKKMILIK